MTSRHRGQGHQGACPSQYVAGGPMTPSRAPATFASKNRKRDLVPAVRGSGDARGTGKCAAPAGAPAAPLGRCRGATSTDNSATLNGRSTRGQVMHASRMSGSLLAAVGLVGGFCAFFDPGCSGGPSHSRPGRRGLDTGTTALENDLPRRHVRRSRRWLSQPEEPRTAGRRWARAARAKSYVPASLV